MTGFWWLAAWAIPVLLAVAAGLLFTASVREEEVDKSVGELVAAAAVGGLCLLFIQFATMP